MEIKPKQEQIKSTEELDLVMKEIHRQAILSYTISWIAVGISSLALIIAIFKMLQKLLII